MDEHVWTSPRNAAEITLEIGHHLAELDPDNSQTYLANAESYAAKIDAMDLEFEAFFQSLPHRTIVFGDRFPLLYFADRYELDYYAAFPGCGTQTEPSAATIAFLTEKVRNENIPTVWYIEFSNHLVADSIAEATERQTAMFHTCHNVTRAEMDAGATYLSLMEQNLETLKANFA
jgi:zinc transport system substrate-binding protein